MEEDEVVLELRGQESDDLGCEIEAAAIGDKDWINLSAKCGIKGLRIRASKTMLARKSSYFRSLFSNFREAGSRGVTITWDMEVFCCILQGIYTDHIDIDPSNAADLLEGATFFGCDSILSDSQSWIISEMLQETAQVNQVVQHIPRMWEVAGETGLSAIVNTCTRYLAIKFEEVSSSDSFVDLPLPLLSSVLDHPLLTVSSEKQLFEAIMKLCNSYQSHEFEFLKKVRLRWLPLDYVLGPLLFDSVLCAPIRIEGAYLLHLFLSCTSPYPASSAAGPFLNHMIEVYPLPEQRAKFSTVQFHKDTNPGNSRVPILASLRELHVGKCWRIQQEELLRWIKTTCSSIQVLKVTDCPQLAVSSLSFLASSCPLIESIELSKDVSVLHASMVKQSHVERIHGAPLKRGSWGHLQYLTSLSLQGRTELTDVDLGLISRNCASISEMNITGCGALTDPGISVFLHTHPSLTLLRAAFTAFGFQSVCVLAQKECPLIILDLSYCRGLSEGGLVRLLKQTLSLKDLAIRSTNLIDDALLAFSGVCLESLNVQGTLVSGKAISYVLQRNPGIKYLNFRDCRAAFHRVEALYISTELLHLKAGWGYSSILRNICGLRRLSLGLGTEISNSFFYELPRLCPLLEHLSLCLLDISDHDFDHVMSNLPQLRVLKLRHTLQPLSSRIVESIVSSQRASNLTCLKLENACPSLTNEHLASITTACRSLCALSLTHCHFLDSGALSIISSNLTGLIHLKLEECNKVTCKGAADLFTLRALETLILRHTGTGLSRNFICDAAKQLPLLRCISVDLCDAIEGFHTPQAEAWGAVYTVKLASCRTSLNAFNFQRPKVHKHTIVMERDSCTLRTSIVQERV